MDRAWKAFERRVAANLGTKRIAAAANSQRGDRGADAPDCVAGAFAYQIKKGYRVPGYLRTWLDGIVRMSAPERTGVVVWGPKGARDDDALVLVRFSDWQRLVRASTSTSASAASGECPADIL
jgi:hypothetical protein